MTDDNGEAQITVGDQAAITLLLPPEDGPTYLLVEKPPISRTLIFECGDAGSTACPDCGVYAVTEVLLRTESRGEPSVSECIGRKCHWCGWRGCCEGH